MQMQTLNISLPREVVKKADTLAKREYKTRSELVKTALLSYMKDLDVWNDLFTYGAKVGKKMGITREEDAYKIVDDYRHAK